METCEACKKPIIGVITKVLDGTITEDGEFEVISTESYHPECITVDW